MAKEKGAALVLVILVVLVLTMVGLAAVFYMSVEDRISQNDKLTQAAWHAAQAGLKRGELVFAGVSQSQLSVVLAPSTFNDAHNQVPTSLNDLTTTARLGTVLYDTGANLGGSPLYSMLIGTSNIVGAQEAYSVFVRNDPNDYLTTDGTSYCVDHNGTVVLVSHDVAFTEITDQVIASGSVVERVARAPRELAVHGNRCRNGAAVHDWASLIQQWQAHPEEKLRFDPVRVSPHGAHPFRGRRD